MAVILSEGGVASVTLNHRCGICGLSKRGVVFVPVNLSERGMASVPTP